jgi:hypothetical protein
MSDEILKIIESVQQNGRVIVARDEISTMADKI